jgi:hypothetical protein
MKLNYFSITVYIKDRARPLTGVRQYTTDKYDDVYEITKKSLLKFYYLSDIIKIDVWQLNANSPLVQEYLAKKEKKKNTAG